MKTDRNRATEVSPLDAPNLEVNSISVHYNTFFNDMEVDNSTSRSHVFLQPRKVPLTTTI